MTDKEIKVKVRKEFAEMTTDRNHNHPEFYEIFRYMTVNMLGIIDNLRLLIVNSKISTEEDRENYDNAMWDIDIILDNMKRLKNNLDESYAQISKWRKE